MVLIGLTAVIRMVVVIRITGIYNCRTTVITTTNNEIFPVLDDDAETTFRMMVDGTS